MNRLNSPAHVPFSRMEFAALAVRLDGAHIGIIYRVFESAPLKMLHLGWDHDLRDDPLDSGHDKNYLWVKFAIHPARAKQIAQKCVDVYMSNPGGIPYAFGNPSGAYDANHKFVTSNQTVGLTCASFVVSILEEIGIRLIDRREWGRHSDDKLFFEWMVKALRGDFHPTPPAAKRVDHHVAVSKQIADGAVRYRPTEIVGAATGGYMPISFFEACMLAGEIKPELPNGRAKPPWTP